MNFYFSDVDRSHQYESTLSLRNRNRHTSGSMFFYADTHIYKGRMELFVFSRCTNNGIEPQFSLLTTCRYCLLLILAKGKTRRTRSLFQLQPNTNVCFEPCHQAHTNCLLPRDHVNFPFAYQLIRQPVKITSHFRSLRL